MRTLSLLAGLRAAPGLSLPDEPPAAPRRSGPTELTVQSEAVRLRLAHDAETGTLVLAGLDALGQPWSEAGEQTLGAVWLDDVRVDGEPLGSIDGSGDLDLLASRPNALALVHGPSLLQLHLELQAAPGNAIVHRLKLVNGRREGLIKVGTAATLALRLTAGDWLETIGSDDSRTEWSPLRAELPAGFGNHGLRSGERGAYPLAKLETSEGSGVIVAVNSATSWRIDVELENDLRVLRAGEYRSELELAPGEQAQLPQIVTIFYDGGYDGAVDSLRRYLEAVSARPPRGWIGTPPVVFNTWFGYGTAVGDDGTPRSLLRTVARRAAEVGVEVFVVDAGWYLGNPAPDLRGRRSRGSSLPEDAAPRDVLLGPLGDDFDRGLGTWVENPAKWVARPGDGGSSAAGLRNFSDFVHSLEVLLPDRSVQGRMRFGLWIEPERFDDELDLPDRVPDEWSVPGTPILDFSRPDVVSGMTNRIQRVINEYRVDYLKVDSNLSLGSDSDSGRSGHFWTRYSHGFEQFLDNLRRANPSLFIEHCAAGLRRYWIGMPRVAHSTWLDDDVEVETVGHLLDVTDSLLLPRQKTVLVTEDLSTYSDSPGNGNSPAPGDDPIGQMREVIRAYWGADRRNGGTIGFSDRLDLWGPDQLEAARQALALWKWDVRGRS